MHTGNSRNVYCQEHEYGVMLTFIKLLNLVHLYTVKDLMNTKALSNSNLVIQIGLCGWKGLSLSFPKLFSD